jgi:hypothetical protein
MQAVLRLSTALSSARQVQDVAERTLSSLDLPERPTAASIALVRDDHLRFVAAPGSPRSLIDALERTDLTTSTWLSNLLAGQPVLVEDREEFARQNPGAGVLRLYPSGSWGVLPFRAGTTIGLLSVHFATALPLNEYGLYFSLVSEVLANAMERAAAEDLQREQMRELEAAFDERDRIASTLSTTLLPPTLPELPGFESAGWLVPAGGGDVAGDFYDLFPVGDGDWVAVLGDVCGKGAEAAAVTALARYAARVTALHDPSPARISDVANTALRSDRSDLFCTMAIVHYCARTRQVEVALAGHHPVRLIRNGRVERLGHNALPLGYATTRPATTAVELAPGDVVVLFSDGLIERDPSFGEDELDVALAEGGNADDVAQRIRARLDAVPASRVDDAALLVLSRNAS